MKKQESKQETKADDRTGNTAEGPTSSRAATTEYDKKDNEDEIPSIH